MHGSWTVLKLGGELLEDSAATRQIAPVIAGLAVRGPLIVVHGGGRDIDAECARRGLTKQVVDGLRITDEPVLDAVVSALAGTVNTRLVAALVALELRAVGLTGVDDRLGLSEKAARYTTASGQQVDLGLVGDPFRANRPRLLEDLVAGGYLPVVATLGVTGIGDVLNVNADVLAARLAVQLGVGRLLIAGGTSGVLDGSGKPMSTLNAVQAAEMKRTGVASVGMVAKLDAAFSALEGAVADVRIVSGRQTDPLLPAAGTRLQSAAEEEISR